MSGIIKASRSVSQGGMYGQTVQDGGLLGFLGNVGKAALKGAAGFLTAGPAGAAVGVASQFIGGGSKGGPPARIPTNVPALPTPGILGGIQRVVPGGKSGYVSAAPAEGMRGYHLNKSDYFLKDGTYVPKGSRWVKNRRRDPLNPRALRRAISRIDAGKVWQAKLREVETGKYTKAGKRKAR